MTELEELRDHIDDIDKQMVHLFEARMNVSKQIGECKIKAGKQVFDASRETKKLEAVKNMTSNEINRQGVERMYKVLMEVSREVQRQLTEEDI
ncbi:chorismate mutase [Lachnospiraceae bacterium LCP25S3_G4]